MSSEAILQEMLVALEKAIPVVRAGQYLTLSGFVLLLYDFCLTFAQEVELIWKAPFSTISLIYLLNRYLAPFMLAVDVYDRLGLSSNSSITFCRVWVWLEGYLTVLSFMSIHGLVAMRVHALFGGRFALKIALWVCWLVYAAFTSFLLGYGLHKGDHTLVIEPYFNVCFEQLWSMLWTVWLPSLLFESLLFFLTTLKAIREARLNIYSPITSILYRDGILYFIAIAVATLFSMFTWMLGSAEYEGLAKYWATAVVNVAGCRLVLSLKTTAQNIRGNRQRTSEPGQSSSFLIGAATTVMFNNYGNEHNCYRESDAYDWYPDFDEDVIVMGELPQLGTIYPEEYKEYWEAI